MVGDEAGTLCGMEHGALLPPGGGAVVDADHEQAQTVLIAAQTRVVTALCGALERAPWSSCRATGARFGLVFFYGLKRRREIAVANVRLVAGSEYLDLLERFVEVLYDKVRA